MLNNLTNFFNLIVGRRIKTTLEDSDLIAVGTKQSPALGDYKPTAIKFEDLKNQVAGLQTVSVDGVTITGNGTPGNPLVASIPSSAVNYSNVVFVDPINGNNFTGAINDFTKPRLTISSASSLALSVPGLSSTNRALVYIRRGEYNSPLVQLLNNVDYYCEPGVVFTGAPTIRDFGVAVNSNIYGHCKINALVGTSLIFECTGDSYIVFEFDSIITETGAIRFAPTGSNNRLIVKGNYIYTAASLGHGYAILLRNASNSVINIKHSINSIHSCVSWRNFTGTSVVNCPNINLMPGNVYGGNFKQALIIYDAASTGKITVNGNLNNLDTVNYGGIGSLITFWSAPNTRFTLNGNAYGGVTKALDGNTYTSGLIEINGNLSSSDLYTAWLYGNAGGTGEIVIKNSVITNTNQVGGNYALAINGTAKIFLKDCYITATRTDSDIININGASTNLVLDDCQLYSPGASGSSVSSTAGAVNIRAKNSITNKAVTVDITNIYAPEGTLEVNTNVINPTSIN